MESNVMRHVEHVEQSTVVAWFRMQYPAYADYLFAIPNGGKRGKLEAHRLKKEGVRPGVPDLMLALPNKHYSGFFIEMKAPKELGKSAPCMSKDQKRMLSRLQQVGYKVQCFWGADSAIAEIREYMGL